MRFCRKCGTEVEEGEKFCKHCGELLVQEHNEGTEESIEVKDNTSSFSQEQPVVKTRRLGNKKRNIIILTTIIVVLVAFIGVTFGKNFYIRRNPVSWALYSLQKNYNSDTVYSTTNINWELTKVPSYSGAIKQKNIIEDFSLKIDNKYSKKENVIRLDLSLLYKEKNIISGSIYADKDLVAVDIPELYNKPLYLNWDDINTLLKEDSGKNIKVKDYESLLEFNKSKYIGDIKKDYTTFFTNNLSDNLKKGSSSSVIINNQGNTSSVKCQELIFTMDSNELLNLIQNLFNKVADDKNIKEFVEDKFNEFISTSQKNGDFKNIFGEATDVEELKKQFDEGYDYQMKELKENSKELYKNQRNTFNINSIYKIDSKNYIREIKEVVETNSSDVGFKVTSDTVFNTLGGKIDIEKINYKNGINVMELSEYEQEDILEQISERCEYSISKKFK